MAWKRVDTKWFLPSALNVKMEKFNQARVNGGSNYDSLKVAGEQKAQVISFRRRDTSFCPQDGAKPQ